MQVSSISNSIISTLGNPESRIPLAVKDIINSTGITYFSFDAGGKLEGKDRLIDEFGTEAIWLFGLPFFKTLANKTIYKFRKLNPNVDVRVANSADHIEFAKRVLRPENPAEKKVLGSIDEAVKRLPEFKKLFYSKFGLATTLTFVSYYGLTKYKQKVTEKAVTKEYLKQKVNEEFFIKKSLESKQFQKFNKVAFSSKKDQTSQPSFKGVGVVLEPFMFNPVKNMLVVDAGITTERLTKSRNKLEFMEYAIKEGSLLFLLYLAGDWINKGMAKFSESAFKLPIDLDLRFINSQTMKQAFGSYALNTEIKNFKELKTQKEILNYLADNQGSTIVKGAKISGLIKQIKNSTQIDPSAYIDTEEIKSFVDSLEKFVKAGEGQKVQDYLRKARNSKIGAILGSMAICCTALGYVVPKIMFEYRKKNSGSKEFHVVNQVKEKLDKQFSEAKI